MRTVRLVCGVASLLILLVVPLKTGAEPLGLATGSPYELGLVDALFDEFKKDVSCDLAVTKAGSGTSLKLLREGAVDVVMVHAPAAEKRAVEEGWALNRTYIGSNDFVVVGPAEDPAGIQKCGSVVCAYHKIAQTGAVFVSRGDNSGTNKKELAIWNKAGINPKGEWYIITHDFMMESLVAASSLNAYFMTDRSTYIVAQKKHPELNAVILFEGDPILVNRYHALTVNPDRFPMASYEKAKKFVEFMAGAQGRAIITAFGVKEYGAALYFVNREQ